MARRLPSPPELRREGAPGLGSGSRISRWRHWWAGFVRRERYPTRSLNLGVQSLFLGHLEDARAWFEQAARECDGAYPEPYDYLGAVALLQDRPRDAIRAYRIVLQDRPRDAIARRHLENLTGEPARP